MWAVLTKVDKNHLPVHCTVEILAAGGQPKLAADAIRTSCGDDDKGVFCFCTCCAGIAKLGV